MDDYCEPPPRWIHCPRRSEVIAEKFIAMKTPLDSKFNDSIPASSIFNVDMVISLVKGLGQNIGLWLDLTNTKRYYKKEEVEQHEIHYSKLYCKGHDGPPEDHQVECFIRICDTIFKKVQNLIVVHCTHGFNRTGYMIISYLVERLNYSVRSAVLEFAKCRPPGIYKEEYIKKLFLKYDEDDIPPVPAKPNWSNESTKFDDDGLPIDTQPESEESGTEFGNPNASLDNVKIQADALFMEGQVPGVNIVLEKAVVRELRKKCCEMCGSRKPSEFPGSQPVSMGIENIKLLNKQLFKVSWKADGLRYMMLINGENAVYMIDREFNFFHVENLTFPWRKDYTVHLHDTLVDGEMVLDESVDEEGNKVKRARYLIYDIVFFKGTPVWQNDFQIREKYIKCEIIDTRNAAVAKGFFDNKKESFSVRQKQFYDVTVTEKLIGPKFAQQLGHECDGLIFQPCQAEAAYPTGRYDKILKWKPPHLNSIDFKVEVRVDKPKSRAELPELNAHLMVLGCALPFVSINNPSKELQSYNGKIVEMSIVNNKWEVLRERTDKVRPNALRTAQNVLASIRSPITSERLTEFIKNFAKRPNSQKMLPPASVPRKRPAPDDSQNGDKEKVMRP